MSEPCIDLTYTAWSRVSGQFTIAGTWFRYPNGEYEPCLFITPARAYYGKPAVVMMSSAYLYVEPREAAHHIRRLAAGMGMDTLNDCVKLGDLVNNHLSDLLSMAPRPHKPGEVADITISVDGGPERSIVLLQ